MRLNGKLAIVTGAGGGFGEGIANRFVEEGAKVTVADIRLEQAQRVAKGLGAASAVAVGGDVSLRADIETIVKTCTSTFGAAPDIIVNNAGITHKNQPVLDVEEDMFDRVFDVNVKSIYFMTRAAVPLMREKGGGVILNVGSTAGLRPRPGLTWYNASKGAVNVMSKSLSLDLAPDKIRVNCLCPVIGETGLLETFMGVPDTPENRAKFVATIPLARMSRPLDVANAAVYLASEEAEFITGVELAIDGGRTV